MSVCQNNDEGNPQPSRREIEGRFRDYNHSIQTDITKCAEDDGIVQPTTTEKSAQETGSGMRRAGFKIRFSQESGSSILPGGTIFYKLVTYDENNQENSTGKFSVQLLLKNNGRFMINGEAVFKKDIEAGKYRMELADRVRNDQIFESDLFFLKNHLTENFDSIPSFKFLKV